MAKLIDTVGHVYGRLTVLKSLGVRGRKQFVQTKCVCGNIFESAISNIRSGNTLSCGCLRKEVTAERVTKHGHRNTRLYRVYTAMLQRCHNPNDRSYARYGARGITVCDEWKNSIDTFLEWAKSTGYSDSFELDRKNVDNGYFPENCRWVTQTIQARNKRTQQHSSRYTGVHFLSSKQRWIASITVNKKRIYLGRFIAEEDAWLARCSYIDANNLQDFQTNRHP